MMRRIEGQKCWPLHRTTVGGHKFEPANARPSICILRVKPETATFHIEGMSCAIGCAKTIEKKLSEMNGVQKATVDFDKKTAVVDFDATIQTPEKLTKAVESTGDGETYKVSQMKIKA